MSYPPPFADELKAEIVVNLQEASLHFWPKVDIRGPDECWPWNAYVNPITGYGQYSPTIKIQLALGFGRITTAPTMACTLAHGLRAGRQVLHSCDVKNCVNPAHLRWGTHAENNHEAWQRTRRWGENHPNSKYPDSVVVALLRDVRTGSSIAAAARKHDVNIWTAYSWVRRGVRPHAWRALQEADDGERDSRGQ